MDARFSEAPHADLMESPHPCSFIHICSKQNGLILLGGIPSGLIKIGLWSEELALT